MRAVAPFVGRDAQMERLLQGLRDAASGRGRLFLVSGEPGIGKSRLLDELEGAAAEQGALVLAGRCWEAGGAPAYWPWTQSLRGYIRNAEPEALARQVGDGSDLVRIVPDLKRVLAHLPDPSPEDNDAARFRLFEAVANFLWEIAIHDPLIVVLDDLHASDTPSLLLLRFLASELTRARVLLVGAYRDTELANDARLAGTVTELLREPASESIPLVGLTRDAVETYIAIAAGAKPARRLVDAVYERTAGNPLFVGEVVRLLIAEGRLDDQGSLQLNVPLELRETIHQRIGLLSEECRQILTLASVLGREFPLDVLADLAGASSRRALEILDDAVAARLLGHSPEDIGRMRFSHALVRDALYEDLPPSHREEMHRRAAETIEARYAGAIEEHFAELAAHFLAAREMARAVDYGKRAADRAMTQVAYEEATRLYELALRAHDLAQPSERVQRCDLLLASADALLKGGDGPAAKRKYLDAAAVAREARLPEHLARAALGYGGRFVWMRAGRDRMVVPLLEEALRALPDEDGTLRAMLMARLAGALRDLPTREPRASISRGALEMARRLNDPETVAYALISRYTADWGPETAHQQLEIARELVALAQSIGDRDREVEGHFVLVKSYMTLGDMRGVYAALADSTQLAQELRQPSQQWYAAVDRTVLALFEGRFAAAEKLVPEVLRVGKRALGMDPEVAYRLQLVALRTEQGRAHEVEDLIRQSIDEYPSYQIFRCVLANLYAQLGRRTDAKAVYAGLADEDFSAIPVDNEWLFGIAWLAEVAEFLGDSRGASVLYNMLKPYGELNAYSPPELCLGSVSRYLGIFAASMGRWDDMARHFEDAIAMNGCMGARPWLAHSQHDYARALLAQGGKESLAEELLTDAVETAYELGMPALADRVSKLLETLGSRETKTPRGVCTFRKEGDFWTLAYDGKAIRLKDAKGLAYIHRLLSEPGRELHVSDLAGAPADGGHGGEILDHRARAEYARRIEDLKQEIEEAEDWGDHERSARGRAEIDFIAEHLSAAYGLGGRVRRGADVSERVRKAVTNRIRASLALVAKANPTLERHLTNSIATGTFCRYSPDRPVRWQL